MQELWTKGGKKIKEHRKYAAKEHSLKINTKRDVKGHLRDRVTGLKGNV